MKSIAISSAPSRARRTVIVALGLMLCLSLTAAKCGSSKTNAKPSPSRSSVITLAPIPVPATTAPATPTSTPEPSATGEPADDLSGDWSGTWTDIAPDTRSGSFHLTWKQTGSSLAGTISVTGTECISAGTLTGSLKGSKITFGAVHGLIVINYTGTVSSGSSMHGTYSTNIACSKAHGTWTAARN